MFFASCLKCYFLIQDYISIKHAVIIWKQAVFFSIFFSKLFKNQLYFCLEKQISEGFFFMTDFFMDSAEAVMV